MMQSDMVAVGEVFALTPQKALDEAQLFLARQGYATVNRTDSSLIVHRLPQDRSVGNFPSLTITALPHPEGGVNLIVGGDDQEGVEQRRAAWDEWTGSLPRLGEAREVPTVHPTSEPLITGDASSSTLPQERTTIRSFSTATRRDVDSPEGAASGSKGKTEWILGGLVGFMALITVLLFVSLIAVPSDSSDAGDSGQGNQTRQGANAAAGGSQTAGTGSAQSGRPTVSIGQPLTVGGVSWTVTNARQTTELRQRGFGSLGDTKRGNFVVVDFVFTNDSNEAVTLDTMSLALVDGQGRKSEADSDTFGYVPARKDIFLENVNPGVTREGQAIFTVAPDASGFKLQAGDTDFWSNKKGFVDLGF